jgi:hypothetical protein
MTDVAIAQEGDTLLDRAQLVHGLPLSRLISRRARLRPRSGLAPVARCEGKAPRSCVAAAPCAHARGQLWAARGWRHLQADPPIAFRRSRWRSRKQDDYRTGAALVPRSLSASRSTRRISSPNAATRSRSTSAPAPPTDSAVSLACARSAGLSTSRRRGVWRIAVIESARREALDGIAYCEPAPAANR